MKKKTANIHRRTQKVGKTIYVYEDHPYWDTEKQQTRHDRDYIGKMINDEFVPNEKYKMRMKLENLSGQRKQEPKKEVVAKRVYSGATYLLDQIGQNIGVVEDLKKCFPSDYKKLLSLAYYLVLESGSPMYRFTKWAQTHKHPFGKDIASQRISELFGSISEGAKMSFFTRQSSRRLETEYLAYDTTSISSYSELISHVKYGKNKDHDALPQINLALIFGQSSMLPVYYRKLPGNITDVATVGKLIKDITFMELKKVKLVMDRGFYSAKNINDLYKNDYQFIIGAKSSTKLAKSILDKERASLRTFKNYDVNLIVYGTSCVAEWEYEELDESGKCIHKSTKPIYVHTYYNDQRDLDERTTFHISLAKARQCVLDNNVNEDTKRFCDTYFNINKISASQIEITSKDEVIEEHSKNFGYFTLLSSEIKDPFETLHIYRNKDMIEKSFNNLKNRLNMRRTSVSSNENLEGKLFVQFLALIYVSAIHKVMKENELYKNDSMQTLLDSLDIIEQFDYPNQKHHFGEITKKQRQLYDFFGVVPPDML